MTLTEKLLLPSIMLLISLLDQVDQPDQLVQVVVQLLTYLELKDAGWIVMEDLPEL